MTCRPRGWEQIVGRATTSESVALLSTALYSLGVDLQEGCPMCHSGTIRHGFSVQCMWMQMCLHVCMEASASVFLNFFSPHPLKLSY